MDKDLIQTVKCCRMAERARTQANLQEASMSCHDPSVSALFKNVAELEGAGQGSTHLKPQYLGA